jgi:hypothetical protein
MCPAPQILGFGRLSGRGGGCVSFFVGVPLVLPPRGHDDLVSLLYAQGDLIAAKPYFERDLQIFRLRLGQDHAYTHVKRVPF